jgi:hypothetical protein
VSDFLNDLNKNEGMYIFGFLTNYVRIKTVLLPHLNCPSCQQKGFIEMTFLQEEQDGVVIQRLNRWSATKQG